MKIDRHGKGKVLTTQEIQLLFNQGLKTLRDRCLFGVCLYTAARINEACTLRRVDVYDKQRQVRPELIIRKKSTKGKLDTRCIPVGEDLQALLSEYSPPLHQYWLFPGRHGKSHINPMSASRILRIALEELGIEGASTHSLRRTALTTMHNSRVPLRIIQQISGHHSLATLEEYLAVSDEQLKGAISSLSHLSYVNKIGNIGLEGSEERNSQEHEIEQ
ncbi:MAG: site-specific integrase [Roseofilum sp. SBFL]|uniref:tyrosine-type recombinase/integrase n=1 Tax=unclassified Roseofilum TaxID=2620099 RepID=UPI001B0D5C66|nr:MULTISPECIES: site-specific integrase [unclassified Roseofilum]MBP0012443.1 site-specific integrase [Roseofilum sp. SID3]MBP0041688.1 site-specific integrase [Roseofilum sp. SBFL]